MQALLPDLTGSSVPASAAEHPGSGRDSAHPALAYLVCLPPFALLVWFISDYGVNVPFLDQWIMPYEFQDLLRWHHGLFPAMWNQHNEHRVFFPKLIWITFGVLSHWNTKWEMFGSAFFAFLTCIAVIRIANRRRRTGDEWPFYFGLLFSSVVILSLSQYENWLDGFQLAFVMVQACMVWAVFWITNECRRIPVRFFMGVLFCVIASFSCGQGLLSWVAAAPCALAMDPKRKQRLATFWIISFILTLLVYFHGWHSTPESQGAASYALRHPQETAQIFSALLGMNFDPSNPHSAIAYGVMVLLLSLTAVLIAIRNALEPSLMPWLSLGLFSLGFAGSVAVGRSTWGFDKVISYARYASVGVFLIVALVQVFMILARKRWAKIAFCTLLVLVCGGLFSQNSMYALEAAAALRYNRELGRDCIEIVDYIDSVTDGYPGNCLHTLYPLPRDPGLLRERIHILEILGFRHSQHHAVFRPFDGEVLGRAEGVRVEESTYPVDLVDSRQVTVYGVALTPAHSRSLILLSYPGERGFFAGGLAEGSASGAGLSRWQISFPAMFLSGHTLEPNARLYDPKTAQFLQLKP